MSQDQELSLEAKQSIRNYLLKLFALPAIVIAILPFLISYFVKDVAQTKAEFEVSKEAQVQLSKLTQKLYEDINSFNKKTINSKVIAEQELKKTVELYAKAQQNLSQTNDLNKATSDAVNDINKLNLQAKKIQASLKLQQDYASSANLVKDVSNALSNNNPFVQIVESSIRLKVELPVGTVISSFVAPEKFVSNDKNWVPADGRQISPDSRFSKLTGEIQVPDIRGMFLRGLNEFENRIIRSDGNQDPNGKNRTAGDFQDYATAIPHTKFTGKTNITGSHSHSAKAPIAYNSGAGKHGRAKPDGSANTSSNGDHEHTVIVDSGGDNETRPKNISVFYYVKIN